MNNGHNVHMCVVYHGGSRCQPIKRQTDNKRSPLAVWANKRTATVLDVPLNGARAVMATTGQPLPAIYTEGLGEAPAYSIRRQKVTKC